MMIAMVRLLNARPGRGIPFRGAELRAKERTPFGFVTLIKRAGIERPEGIAADAVLVFENEAQIRLKRQIGSDVNPAKSIRIFPIEWLAIVAVIAGLEADVISAGLVAHPGATDCAGGHAGDYPRLVLILSMEFRVGCSGWFYWHWKHRFYPAELPVSEWFQHYRRRF